MISALLALLATIISSIAHGANWLPKGVIMALHALVIAGALWLAGVTSYELLVTLSITAIYWFLFRTGSQAKAELDAMATEAWQDFRFYGVGQTQSQFDALLDVMNAAGAGISSNPNDYILTAAGHAPEIAFADSPSWLMQWSNNFFVRGE